MLRQMFEIFVLSTNVYSMQYHHLWLNMHNTPCYTFLDKNEFFSYLHFHLFNGDTWYDCQSAIIHDILTTNDTLSQNIFTNADVLICNKSLD